MVNDIPSLISGADRRASEESTDREFRESLRRVDRTTSWFLWTSVLMILLVPAAFALLSLPYRLSGVGPLRGVSTGMLGRALLGVLWLVIMLTIPLQRQLRTFRRHLVDQMDAATKQRLKAERYYGLSILDPLTGLYNRRFGEERLREEIERAERSGGSLSVLALDFDRFKEINDKYGHAAGDLALKAFSRRLQRAIRACDLPIRVGGDEFLVILPECSLSQVDLILSRINPVEIKLEGQRIPVYFSNGVAQYQVNDTPEVIIGRADERLYNEKAKRASVRV